MDGVKAQEQLDLAYSLIEERGTADDSAEELMQLLLANGVHEIAALIVVNDVRG